MSIIHLNSHTLASFILLVCFEIVDLCPGVADAFASTSGEITPTGSDTNSSGRGPTRLQLQELLVPIFSTFVLGIQTHLLRTAECAHLVKE